MAELPMAGLTVKVGFAMAEEVTDSTAEATELVASWPSSSTWSRTSLAEETAPNAPRARMEAARMVAVVRV
jgi:hypothetical protein